jgi:hypothetical protein
MNPLYLIAAVLVIVAVMGFYGHKCLSRLQKDIHVLFGRLSLLSVATAATTSPAV